MTKQPNTRSRATMACCTLESILSPRLFKALADANRVRLVLQLAACGRSCTVGELAECLTVDVSVVSRHLALLREAGVLQSTKEGKQVRYSLRYGEVAMTLRQIASAIDACCPKGTCCG